MVKVGGNKKTALITGGSSGIGLAIAHELAARGYNMMIISNQTEALSASKKQLESDYLVTCTTYNCDLTDPKAAQEIFQFTQERAIEVEILVNNAGILIFSEVAELDDSRILSILQLHVHTPVLLCKLFGKEMKRRQRGFILNVSSISAVMPYPGISLYGPTKTFLRYFTRSLRHEMKIYGVAVTCLLPGATLTGLYDPSKVNLNLARKTGIMQTPEFVARKAIREMFRKKPECIPGWINKLTVILLPLIPKSLICFIHKNTNILQKGKESLG